jgi:hypothetical protein
MKMLSTPRIELFPARRASGFASHVLLNGQLRTAGPTENRWLAPFRLRPDLDRVTGQRGVAIFAGIVNPATLHLDRNNVSGSAIMLATSLRIKMDAPNFWNSGKHGAGLENHDLKS